MIREMDDDESDDIIRDEDESERERTSFDEIRRIFGLKLRD